MSKEMEGDEDQRRAAARAAHRAGEEPSALGVTTGASNQWHHLRHSEESHEERLERHRGKQKSPLPPPPGRAEEERTFEDRPEYDAEHQRVFQALEEAEAANGGNGVYLEDLARRVDLPVEETRQTLHDLAGVERLVTEPENTGDPVLGPRFTIKPRL
jgi:hypothetical protein